MKATACRVRVGRAERPPVWVLPPARSRGISLVVILVLLLVLLVVLLVLLLFLL